MSGHSKWAQIKHKKGKEDARRGQMFSKLSRAITVAARLGGGNPNTNAALEAVIQKARDYNMPADTIERAIKKGTGELAGAAYEQITYEGYGPNGVAIMVEVMTDNRNRAASEVRYIFTKYGGSLGTPGSVNWMFKRKGQILVNKDIDEDTLMSIALEAGAEDINPEENHWEVVTASEDLVRVRKMLEEHNIPFTAAEIVLLPQNTVELGEVEARKVLRLVEALEDADDVQEVYANFDIAEEVLEEIAAS